MRHSAITPENVRERVHGAIFTRGPDDLHNTALFVGGSDVARGEQVLAAVVASFIGPLRTSVMMDSGGANTTAAAAVLAAAKHLDLALATALVLAATGPVGQRVAWLLAREGATCGLPRDGWTAPKKSPPRFAKDCLRAHQCHAASARQDELAAALRGRNLGRGGRRRRRRAAAATGDAIAGRGFARGDRSRMPSRRWESPASKVTDKAVERNGVTVLRRHRRRRHEDENPQSRDQGAVRGERPGTGRTGDLPNWPRIVKDVGTAVGRLAAPRFIFSIATSGPPWR